MKNYKVFLFLLTLVLSSCEKDIEIDLPEDEQKIVVEGSIEQGQPPFVLLTKSTGFFEPTDIQTLNNLFVKGAIVTVSNGTNTVQLTEVCSDQLPQNLLPSVAELIGVSVEDIETFGFCLYTSLDPTIFGEIGKTYQLTVQAEGKVLTSSTKIPPLVPMDSYWYKDYKPGPNVVFGYLWFNLNDPPQIGNSYRIYTKRLGKDDRFIPTDGSVFDDSFFNGKDFDAFVFAGHELSEGYFQEGDVIAIKFASIDQAHFQFWNSFEIAVFNNGNPFAAPATIKTNIEGGGLGVWGGYGATYDTIVAVD